MDEDMTQLDRIERRMDAYELVVREVLGTLEAHTERLDAILKAATAEPGPSPVADALKQILQTMETTNSVLIKLPGEIAERVRVELDRVDEAANWTEASDPASGFGRDSH